MKPIVAAHETLVSPLKSTQTLKAPPPPTVPLRITDLCSEGTQELVPNSRVPTAVTSKHFDGHVLLKLKTDPEDSHYAPYFAGKKRMFEIQVQGRLLDVHEDEEVYIGIECPAQLQMGLWSRFASSMVLQLLHALVHQAHASYGSDDGLELPHITMPLNTTADRLIVSAPGEEAPPLGVDMLPELMSKAERHAVREYHSTHTYTMSFHSMYVDWCTWQLVNVPGLHAVGLNWFFGDSPVRFVAYTVPRAAKDGVHTKAQKKYLFCLELQSLISQC